MAATETPTLASRLPGPPEYLPGKPDAVIDLQTDEGVALVAGAWRYADAGVREIDFVEVGAADDPLGPGDKPNRTYDIVPHAEASDYDDSGWRVLVPEETMLRLATGRVCFNWYRIKVTIPERVGDFDPTGATVVFEIVVDDYAEVWVNGELPLALGDAGGRVVGGFNAPNRVVLARDIRPGDEFQITVFGMNGPISASPPIPGPTASTLSSIRWRARRRSMAWRSDCLRATTRCSPPRRPMPRARSISSRGLHAAKAVCRPP